MIYERQRPRWKTERRVDGVVEDGKARMGSWNGKLDVGSVRQEVIVEK
jgi:hypothetical protein